MLNCNSGIALPQLFYLLLYDENLQYLAWTKNKKHSLLRQSKSSIKEDFSFFQAPVSQPANHSASWLHLPAITHCSEWVTDLQTDCSLPQHQLISNHSTMQSQYCVFLFSLCEKQTEKTVYTHGDKEEATKESRRKYKAKKNRGSCVSGLRMSCNLMSVDESWLSELTQFFALLVTVLSLMMFAPDYRCHSQCWIAFFWSYVFLCATTLFVSSHVQNAELGSGSTQDDITHTVQQTSV